MHFGGLEDDREDSTAPNITFKPQLGHHRQCGLARGEAGIPVEDGLGAGDAAAGLGARPSEGKMGPEFDPMAVVDQYGKVYGVTGLRVADASIMPDCIRANTNVTTMAIGEQVSDFIRKGK